MIASTLTITIATQRRDRIAWTMFPVAMSRITNANAVAIVIPLKAEDINAFSVGNQAQSWPAVYTALFIPSGALAL